MKKTISRQAGFGAHAVIIALLVVAVVGFAGYKVFTMNKATNTAMPATTSGQSAELTSEKKELDQSQANLNSNLDDASLDADLNSML